MTPLRQESDRPGCKCVGISARARKKRPAAWSSRRRPFTSVTAAGLLELYSASPVLDNPSPMKPDTPRTACPGSRHIRITQAWKGRESISPKHWSSQHFNVIAEKFTCPARFLLSRCTSHHRSPVRPPLPCGHARDLNRPRPRPELLQQQCTRSGFAFGTPPRLGEAALAPSIPRSGRVI